MFRNISHIKIKSDIRFLFLTPIIWIPAFGWMPEGSITFEIMKVSAIFVMLLSMYVWIGGIQSKKSRAWVYIAIQTTPILLTSLVFYVRFIELIVHTFFLPLEKVFFWVLTLTIISLQRSASVYRNEIDKLNTIREMGLLIKYKIFNERDALWKITSFYPGVDGSSPEQQAKKEQQRWGCITLIPASGISFFLIRTIRGSVAWILLFIYILMHISFVLIGVKLIAVLFLVRKWELELGRPIYTDTAT
jgi:hypothetical protein